MQFIDRSLGAYFFGPPCTCTSSEQAKWLSWERDWSRQVDQCWMTCCWNWSVWRLWCVTGQRPIHGPVTVVSNSSVSNIYIIHSLSLLRSRNALDRVCVYLTVVFGLLTVQSLDLETSFSFSVGLLKYRPPECPCRLALSRWFVY